MRQAYCFHSFGHFFRGDAQSWRRYDKGRDRISAYSEKTDARLPILEGWCVGVAAQADAASLTSLNMLEQQQDPDVIWRRKVNQQLADDYQQIWQLLNHLLWLNAPDWGRSMPLASFARTLSTAARAWQKPG